MQTSKHALILMFIALMVFPAIIQNAAARDTLSVQIVPPSKTTIFIYNVLQLEAQATGGPGGYNYQWYANDTAINNATSSTYMFNGTQVGDYGIKCVVTDATGAILDPATSQTLYLHVSPPAVPGPTPSLLPKAINPNVSGNADNALSSVQVLALIIAAVVVVVVLSTVAIVVTKRRTSKKSNNS